MSVIKMEEKRDETDGGITPDMTVRDVNIRYPQAMAVFEKYGIAGCGGKYGPPESLAFFAQAHKVDCGRLMEDVRAAISAGQAGVTGEHAGEVKDDNILYRGFVRAAIVCAMTGGATWGLWILLRGGMEGGLSLDRLVLAETHADVQVYGWVGFFIMGFAYHAIPRFKNTPLRLPGTVHLSMILVATALLMRFFAQPWLRDGPIFAGLFVSSAILLLIGYLAFISSMVVTVRGARGGLEYYEMFILASLAWALVSVVMNIVLVLGMVERNMPLLTPGMDEIFRHVQFLGFITMMILGVSYRILPGFMGIEEANRRSVGAVFILFNAGILLWLAGSFTGGETTVRNIGLGVESAASLLAVSSLNIFKPRRGPVGIGEGDSFFPWYMRLAYAWLLVAMAMSLGGALFEVVARSPLPHSFIDAYRHALAMGFVTMMIFGLAQRVLPVWEGKRIYSTLLVTWVFLLVTVGNVMRVLFQSLGGSVGRTGHFLSSTGGSLELAAFAIFAVNIWRTLGLGEESIVEEKDREEAAVWPSDIDATISMFGPKTRVFEILMEHPEAADLLREMGIRDLPDAERFPKFLTIERLCKSNNIETGKVIAALEKYCSGGDEEGGGVPAS